MRNLEKPQYNMTTSPPPPPPISPYPPFQGKIFRPRPIFINLVKVEPLFMKVGRWEGCSNYKFNPFQKTQNFPMPWPFPTKPSE